MASAKPKIILNVDTGPDDALAILLAIKSKNFEIKGITTGFGNTNLRQATVNTLKVLNLAQGLDIPVFQGASKPLKGKGQRGKTSGKGGLCEVNLPIPDKKEGKLRAEKFIIDTIGNCPKEIVIVNTAPSTTIAKALKQNLKIKEKIKRIIIMGGTIEIPGNITPFAEFNFFNDPLAAQIIFESGVPITLIPLDVTTKLLIKRDWLLRKCGKSKDPITKFIVSLVNNRYRLVGKDWFYLHDPLAVGVAINKNFVKAKKVKLKVITQGKQKGQVIKNPRGSKIEVAVDVRKKDFLIFFKKLLLK